MSAGKEERCRKEVRKTNDFLILPCYNRGKAISAEIKGKREESDMTRTVAIGYQDFETIRTRDYFYIDK